VAICPGEQSRTITLPVELTQAEALAVFYAQALHWGIANPYAKSMGHNRYQVFPARGMRFFLVEILPGEAAGIPAAKPFCRFATFGASEILA